MTFIGQVRVLRFSISTLYNFGQQTNERIEQFAINVETLTYYTDICAKCVIVQTVRQTHLCLEMNVTATCHS